MNLSYSDSEGYKGLGKKNSVSITIPNFIKFRKDKEANAHDVRFDQLREVVSFEETDSVNEKT